MILGAVLGHNTPALLFHGGITENVLGLKDEGRFPLGHPIKFQLFNSGSQWPHLLNLQINYGLAVRGMVFSQFVAALIEPRVFLQLLDDNCVFRSMIRKLRLGVGPEY